MYAAAPTELLRMQAAAGINIVSEIAPIAATSAPPAGWPTGFGSALWPIAKLIAAGYPIEIATADLGGWDEHNAMGSATDPTSSQYKLLASLDAALGAGVNPGVHGGWPGLLDSGNADVRVVNDYRKVYAEVLSRRLRSTDMASVFPGFDTSSSNPARRHRSLGTLSWGLPFQQRPAVVDPTQSNRAPLGRQGLIGFAVIREGSPPNWGRKGEARFGGEVAEETYTHRLCRGRDESFRPSAAAHWTRR
jgi:hypothetical protein